MCRAAVQILFFLLFSTGTTLSQPGYEDYPVHRNNKAIIAWAKNCVVVRGLARIDDPSSDYASFGVAADATGPADDYVVSLGDGGVAICSLTETARNNPGPDFAIFENSFDGNYLELAFVEVSTDSIRWVRFPAVSNTQTVSQIGGFGNLNSSLVYNLAGKYVSSFGTTFDLDDLSDSAGIDINEINYIRVVDVIGTINPAFASYDSRGIIINDPWPTPFPQSGFDLDAVAVLNGNLVGVEEDIFPVIALYPVPAGHFLTADIGSQKCGRIRILDAWGHQIYDWRTFEHMISIDVSLLKGGVYLAEIYVESMSGTVFRRFIKG
ncbi:MAG: T9SS type A sorting domain-containing protein [Bacteroidales bacterium]|nr:T9SS type A sorting domain-containing protein [Bacteroidales bacterium]